MRQAKKGNHVANPFHRRCRRQAGQARALGATPQLIRDIRDCGVQVVTMGNHTWRRADLAKEIDSLKGVVRPANFPPGVPGKGRIVFETGGGRLVGVINLLGRTYMNANDCPFRIGLDMAEDLKEKTPIVIVDMHAEATSEKMAMGLYLDGKVSAVLGTHTHVQTADERILPGGTAYITDVGMTGPHSGVIGMKAEQVLTRFVTGMPARYEVAEEDMWLHGVVVDIDDSSGRAQNIELTLDRSGAFMAKWTHESAG
jgi:metallophosphoesterase (TIGR00282 family)